MPNTAGMPELSEDAPADIMNGIGYPALGRDLFLREKAWRKRAA